MTSPLPSGTVTFLFTDIEGSTKLAQQYPDAMPALLAQHNEILYQAIEAHQGFVFRVVGDSFSAAFQDANDALQAALNAQRRFYNEAWSPISIKVRMGIHIGSGQLDIENKENAYAGYATLALTQRIMSAGHGGQILLSQSTYDLTRDRLPDQAQLVDMGERHLKDILRAEHLYQLVVPDLPAEFPPLNTLEILNHNLPTQLTSFVGREKEINEIKGLLDTTHLLTLTGSGGTGKTRLAQEVGAQLLTKFRDGVWIVELAPLSDGSQITPALAQVFGLQELPFRPLAAQILDFLRDKKTLLILDNCEHLIKACARLADDLLHQCAGLKILASSREALGIAGEIAYHVPSLADSESTQLFVDRARAANSNFKMTDANAASIAQVCHRLDGIPLAIELAAARTKLLAPEQIAARLDDVFRLLVGGSRTALPRQQTLRALIDWSYDLLSNEEKFLLQFASVFVGGWTLDALEFVSNDSNTLEVLEQLVNKSLVTTEERHGEMRYFLLETIRQYAREKLFEAEQSPATRDRHFSYFNQFSEKFWGWLRSENIPQLFQHAEDEIENLRAALEWGLENHVEENLRLVANFCIVSLLLGTPGEGMTVATMAVERARALPPVEGDALLKRQKSLARILYAQSMDSLGTGDIHQVIEWLTEAIALSRLTGDKQILGYSLGMYYTASTFINAPEAEEAARESLEIFSHAGEDPMGLGMAYLNMARVYSSKGDEMETQKYFGKLRELLHETPRSFEVGLFYLGMGVDESRRGNYAKAKKIFEEGMALFKGIRYINIQLILASEIGHIERRTGNLTQARSIYRDTIKHWQNFGNRAAIAHQLECFGFLAIHDEEPQRAAKLIGAAEAVRERAQSPMAEYEQAEYSAAVAQLRSMLPEAEFHALWTAGRSMTMEQAIAFALENVDE